MARLQDFLVKYWSQIMRYQTPIFWSFPNCCAVLLKKKIQDWREAIIHLVIGLLPRLTQFAEKQSRHCLILLYARKTLAKRLSLGFLNSFANVSKCRRNLLRF